jgi:hypothetical protein
MTEDDDVEKIWKFLWLLKVLSYQIIEGTGGKH